ncbi:MAG TPA: RodZ domain-containing protein [Candidatus Didemnitutus sp.]|nr:RodZ domain-containing protein [Candidatus Didemnitutus sp.]
MQTIGERLEEARKRKGISVREAAETTKIRSDYIQKFEANTFDLDLPPLYVRGFIRNYARYLDLDPERLVDEYDALLASEGRAPRRETRENYGRVDFAEGAEGGGRPAMDQAMMLKYGLFGGGALVIILIGVLLVSIFSSHSSSKPPASSTTAATQTAAQPTATAAPIDNSQTLTFSATDATRVKIVQDADKKVIFDGTLTTGETRSFRKTGKLLITVEKGSNLRMEVNGRSYAVPLDGYGRFALD